MKQFSTVIRANRRLSSEFYLLEFSWETSAGMILPGQFFTLRVSDTTVPFLRRPFAFSGFDAQTNTASAIYKRRGRSTGMLAAMKPGDYVDIIGPSGKSFPLPSRETTALVIAGGIGLGPVLFLARSLKSSDYQVTLVAGFRTKETITDRSIFNGLDTVICTDDGSDGYRGTTVDYLAHHSAQPDSQLRPSSVIFACGPAAMLSGCVKIADERHMDCFVSVEQIMACGVGACMGCAVRAAGGGYLRACIEGPVFNSKDLAWT